MLMEDCRAGMCERGMGASMVWLAVAVGGAFGSALRHGVNELFARVMTRPVPYATAAVNLVGAGAIGILAGLLAAGRLDWPPATRAFVLVGVLGGFTTFSSYMLDSLTLTYRGEPGLAFINLAGQVLFGLAAVWSGYYLGAGRL
jgi:CrcB protein